MPAFSCPCARILFDPWPVRLRLPSGRGPCFAAVRRLRGEPPVAAGRRGTGAPAGKCYLWLDRRGRLCYLGV